MLPTLPTSVAEVVALLRFLQERRDFEWSDFGDKIIETIVASLPTIAGRCGMTALCEPREQRLILDAILSNVDDGVPIEQAVIELYIKLGDTPDEARRRWQSAPSNWRDALI